MNNLNEIWDKCLEILKMETNAVSFNNYISCIHPISLNDNKLSLEIPQDTRQNVIRSRYQRIIESALIKATGNEIVVDFITPDGVGNAEFNSAAPPKNNGINPGYNFENFVVGENNRMAFTACLNVAEMPGSIHNPLFIYGAPGLGKTHLMHAIGNFIIENDKNSSVMYVTSESFTNEFITSLQMKKNMQEFRNKYRNCNLLLIDDIQFLAKKKETQEEFFHTFNDLMEHKAQIVISSDRPPREIRDLEERLYSRFSMGLMADISTPGLETRVAILQNKIDIEKMVVPQDVIYYIAETITSNIRELEGSLQRVKAFSKLKNADIDLALTKEAFKGIYDESKSTVITPKQIKITVCEYMNVTLEDLEGTCRSRSIVVPRQIAQYLIRNLSNSPYSVIAEEFTVKDHTTIMHNCEKIDNLIKTDDNIRNSIKDLKSMLVK